MHTNAIDLPPVPEATEQFGFWLGQNLQPGDCLGLVGDLGAGKTTFARAYIHALGYPGYVKSPSYGLLETYEAGGRKVLHLDLYRIEDPEELEFLALRDLFDERSVLLIEWPDRGAGHLPDPDLVLEFGETASGRYIDCSGQSGRGQALARAVARSSGNAVSS